MQWSIIYPFPLSFCSDSCNENLIFGNVGRPSHCTISYVVGFPFFQFDFPSLWVVSSEVFQVFPFDQGNLTHTAPYHPLLWHLRNFGRFRRRHLEVRFWQESWLLHVWLEDPLTVDVGLVWTDNIWIWRMNVWCELLLPANSPLPSKSEPGLPSCPVRSPSLSNRDMTRPGSEKIFVTDCVFRGNVSYFW